MSFSVHCLTLLKTVVTDVWPIALKIVHTTSGGNRLEEAVAATTTSQNIYGQTTVTGLGNHTITHDYSHAVSGVPSKDKNPNFSCTDENGKEKIGNGKENKKAHFHWHSDSHLNRNQKERRNTPKAWSFVYGGWTYGWAFTTENMS